MKNSSAIVVVVLIAIIAVGVTVYLSTSSKRSVTGVWQTEATITQSGNQDTTQFDMDHFWRINWAENTNPTFDFIVSVYMKNGTGFSIVTDAYAGDTNTTTGILPVGYTGSFVIRVLTSYQTQWTLQIQEYVIANQTS